MSISQDQVARGLRKAQTERVDDFTIEHLNSLPCTVTAKGLSCKAFMRHYHNFGKISGHYDDSTVGSLFLRSCSISASLLDLQKYDYDLGPSQLVFWSTTKKDSATPIVVAKIDGGSMSTSDRATAPHQGAAKFHRAAC